MKLEETLGAITKNKIFKEVVGRLSEPTIAHAVAGGSIAEVSRREVAVGQAGRAYFLAALYSGLKKPTLVVTPNYERARRLAADLRAYQTSAKLVPDVETMPYDSLSPSPGAVGKRLAALDEMDQGKAGIWIVSVQSALRGIAPRAAGLHRPVTLKVGDEVDLYSLAERLVALGYSRTPMVEDSGEFSLRGGIIDVFSSNAEVPIRIELFGDEVDSIRPFSVTTQRSVGRFKNVKIYGCRQLVLTEETAKRAESSISEALPEWLEEEVGKLKDLQYFEGVDKYLPALYGKLETVLDYLPADAVVVIDEPEEVSQAAEQHVEGQQSYIEHLIEHKAIIAPPSPYFTDVSEILQKSRLNLVSIGAARASASFKAAPIKPFTGKVADVTGVIKDYMGLGLKVVIALGEDRQIDRMEKLLSKDGIKASSAFTGNINQVSLAKGNLTSGFSSQDFGLAILTFADIFGRRSAPAKKKATGRQGAISSIADLKVGDYVVHSAHGIAVYAGLHKREVAGITRDYALLEYAGKDKLFVPTDQLDKISKYIGAAGETPAVSRLGGSEWLKAKKKAQASVKKVAYDLLSLYASRAKSKGTAFATDTPWQKELEDAFAFDETPDQLSAIEDVKRDMEQEKPMDRLICGDVGYGKTEVAVRAAFKAVVHGKQVMVLVPTTILAQQHFSTFSQRLKQFPVTVEMVSRFKSPAQQKDIIARFNSGQVDILIGTHRLLSQDVKPLNLGLVIIDEEQRFGVNDKEKLRDFKHSVDVLTLSATPIPRTLQMSLAGVRDMSVIETPPEGRHPIVTHVGRYDEEMLIQAIRRELGRGGQVYYVHNRVETIDAVAGRVSALIPEARVAVAHGQMSEHQLEKIMIGFLERKFDVLVCTTIIESGIDIPSVNTLIVDRAEILGLAQLYQLRGRVGRTSQRAYAYFFFSPQKLLTSQAFERLKTISDFTELGSGIKIALRDLEIRGAGSLLGAEQHGYMSQVGFELYCQMLKEAIDEFEGKGAPEPLEIKIDLPVSAYIPESYIAEESLRIEAYKKIVLSHDPSDIEQMGQELTDRYGTPPEAVQRLLDIARLRTMAKKLKVTEIAFQNGRVKVLPVAMTKAQELKLTRRYSNLAVNSPRRYLTLSRVAPDKIIALLLNLFDDIMSAVTNDVRISQKAR